MAVLRVVWPTVREAIRLWIEHVSGLDTYWRDGNVHHLPANTARMLLAMPTIEDLGLRTHGWGSTGAVGSKSNVPYVDRQQRIPLDVSCQASWHEEQSGLSSDWAQDQLSYAQQRAELLQLSEDPAAPNGAVSLDAVCVGFAQAGPIAQIEVFQDNWLLSQATSTWVLYLRNTYQDTDISVESIETVVGAAANGGVIPDLDT